MKNLFAASTLILAVCVVSFAQTNQSLKCPAISVTGPAGIIEPSEIGQFTANFDAENQNDYIFTWTITGGRIIEQNGKDEIDRGKRIEEKGKTFIKFTVSSEVGGESVSATVTIAGLPSGCPDSASESMIVTICYTSVLVDEFSISPKQIDVNKLNNLANEAKKNQTAQIYIIGRFIDKTSSKTIKSKIQKTITYLISQGIERERIVLQNAESKENLTRFVLVPAGAESPNCGDCVKIEAE